MSIPIGFTLRLCHHDCLSSKAVFHGGVAVCLGPAFGIEDKISLSSELFESHTSWIFKLNAYECQRIFSSYMSNALYIDFGHCPLHVGLVRWESLSIQVRTHTSK